MKKLFATSSPRIYNGRPVCKVELVRYEANTVVVETDWPVEQIHIPRQDFDEYFREW